MKRRYVKQHNTMNKEDIKVKHFTKCFQRVASLLYNYFQYLYHDIGTCKNVINKKYKTIYYTTCILL